MKKIIFISLLMAIFFSESCSRKIITKTHTIHDTTSIVVRDRIVDTFIDRDTINQIIEVGCDSLNTPFVKGIGIKNGKRSTLTSYFDSNKIHINAKCHELEIAIRIQDSIIRKQTKELKEYKAVVIKKPTFWDYLKMIGLHILYVAGLIVAYELVRKIIDRFI